MGTFFSHIFTQLTIGAIIAIGIIWLVFWAGGIWKSIKTLQCKEHAAELKALSTISAKVESLQCQQHAADVKELKTLELVVSKFDGKLNGILAGLNASNSISSGAPLVQSQSPLKITSRGQTIADELKIKERISENWAFVNDYINEKASSGNFYDIQQALFDMLLLEAENVLSKEGFDALKFRAFKEGLALYSLQQLAGLVARDMYFEKVGIDIDEIDKYDPTKQDSSPK